MKTFDEIYSELQNSDNSGLNNAWKEAKKENKKAKKIMIAICLIIDILIGIIFKNIIESNGICFIMPMIVICFIINIFVFIIISFLFSKKENQYNLKYKEVVINKIMNNFYNNLEYSPYKPMPEYIYEQVEYEYYDTYESDDYFEAQIDNKYSIQMAEILTSEEKNIKIEMVKLKQKQLRNSMDYFLKL